MSKPKYQFAQAWLHAAFDQLHLLIKEHGTQLPYPVQITVGWPVGERRDRVKKTWSLMDLSGEAWPGPVYAWDRGTDTIFIAPCISDPIEVLSVLLHEMIHLAEDIGTSCGHGPPFSWLASYLGLDPRDPEGSNPTPALRRYLRPIAKVLGPYPWVAINDGGRYF